MPARVDIDLPTSGEFCLGRNPQLKKLSQLWNDGSKNILSLVARGGT